MQGCRIRKLLWTMAGFPTLAAQLPPRAWTKPVLLIAGIIAQPLQRLSLLATDPVPMIKRFDDIHIGFHPGNDRDTPPQADFLFDVLADVGQIPHDNIRHPMQALLALADAGLEQITLGQVRGRSPGAYGNQQDRRRMRPQPQAQCMFFEPNIKFSVAGLARSRPHSGPARRPLAPVFFLSAAAAGRSVASIMATV